MISSKLSRTCSGLAVLLAIAACGSDGYGGGGSTPTHRVGGSISGLNGTIVLSNTSGTGTAENLSLSASGNFVFANGIARSVTYTVTIQAQPADQLCSVTNGSGTVIDADVSNVAVSCANLVEVTGTVTGLSGSGLVLQNNGTDDLAVTAAAGDVPLRFQTRLVAGSRYDITILRQPANPTQTCIVTDGSGVIDPNVAPAVLVSCSKKFARFAYVPDVLDHTLAIFTIDSARGQLRHRGHAASGGQYPVSVTRDPLGKFLYVCNRDSSDVAVFETDSLTGQLALHSTLATGAAAPFVIAAHPGGEFVYLATHHMATPALIDFAALQSYRIVREEGRLEAVGAPVSIDAVALQIDSTGRFLYAVTQIDQGVRAFRMQSEGPLVEIALPAPIAGNRIAAHPTNPYMYVLSGQTGTVTAYRIQMDGRLENVDTPLPLGVTPTSMAVDPLGRFVHVTAQGGTITTLQIDPATGALGASTQVATAGLDPAAATVDPTGRFVYVADDDANILSTFTLDATSRSLTLRDVVAARGAPADIALLQGQSGLAIAPRFVYLGEAAGRIEVLEIDPRFGELTPTGRFNAGLGVSRLLPAPSGDFLFATLNLATNPSAVESYRLGIDGLPTTMGTVDHPGRIAGLVTGATGRYLFTAGSDPTAAVGTFTVAPDAQLQTNGPRLPLPPAGAGDIAVDPAGRFAYATSLTEATISTYRIGNDGRLQQSSATTPRAGSFKQLLAAPSARTVYAIHEDASRTLLSFAVGPQGALIPIGSAQEAGQIGAASMIAIEPTGRFVYLLDTGRHSIRLYAVQSDGSLLDVSGAPITVGFPTSRVLAVDPSGEFLLVAGSTQTVTFRLDPQSGLLSFAAVINRPAVAMAITSVFRNAR